MSFPMKHQKRNRSGRQKTTTTSQAYSRTGTLPPVKNGRKNQTKRAAVMRAARIEISHTMKLSQRNGTGMERRTMTKAIRAYSFVVIRPRSRPVRRGQACQRRRTTADVPRR
jgi:hypothetical protein